MIKIIYVNKAATMSWNIGEPSPTHKMKIVGEVRVLMQTDPIGFSTPVDTSSFILYMPPPLEGQTNPQFEIGDQVRYIPSGVAGSEQIVHYVDTYDKNGDYYTVHCMSYLGLLDNRQFYGRDTAHSLETSLSLVAPDNYNFTVDPSLANADAYGIIEPCSQREAIANLVLKTQAEVVHRNGDTVLRARPTSDPISIQPSNVFDGAKIDYLPKYTEIAVNDTHSKTATEVETLYTGTSNSNKQAVIQLPDWATNITCTGGTLVEPTSSATITKFVKIQAPANTSITVTGKKVTFTTTELTVALVDNPEVPNPLKIGLQTKMATFWGGTHYILWARNTNAIFKGKIKVGTERIGDYVSVQLHNEVLTGWISSMDMKIRKDIFANVEIIGQVGETLPLTRYTVNYSAGDGTGTPPVPEEIGAGETFNLSDNLWFSRNFFNFNGWKYNNTIYQAGQSFTMPANNVEFVAQWKSQLQPPSS